MGQVVHHSVRITWQLIHHTFRMNYLMTSHGVYWFPFTSIFCWFCSIRAFITRLQGKIALLKYFPNLKTEREWKGLGCSIVLKLKRNVHHTRALMFKRLEQKTLFKSSVIMWIMRSKIASHNAISSTGNAL